MALATNRVNSVTTQIYGWAAQTVSYTWDASGNLTSDGLRTYTYDAAGRQKEAGATGQNTVGYDGDGQRVRKIENWGTPIYYVRSSVLKNAAMEVVGGTLARAYVYTGKKLVALQGTDGQFYWVHQDHLNSARKLTNTSGAVVYRGEFDPHGQALLETGSALLNSRKYTGYERDQATGLDYARARMYQSNTARFTSPDPTSLRSADPRRPESLNRYSYVENDPVNSIDPSGKNLEAPDGSSRRSCRFIYGFRGPDNEDIIYLDIVGISCSEVGGQQVGGSPGRKPPCPPVPERPAFANIDANIREMMTSLKTLEEAIIDPFIDPDAKTGLITAFVVRFANLVRKGGLWDYKQHNTRENQYTPFGNFHYGATGAAAGFTEGQLLRAAGFIQKWFGDEDGDGGRVNIINALTGTGWEAPFMDQTVDQDNIKAGIDYFNRKFIKKDCE